MVRLHGVGVVRHAGCAGADVAHLRPAIFRIKIGLGTSARSSRIYGFEARDARLDPLFHRQMVRFDACFVGYG